MIVALIFVITIAVLVFYVGSDKPTTHNNLNSYDIAIKNTVTSRVSNVSGFIKSPTKQSTYYCYINHNTTVIKVNSDELLVSIYDKNNYLIDYFTIRR